MSGEVCIRNIDQQGVNMRRAIGVVALAAAAVAAWMLISSPMDRWLRIFVFPALYVGVQGLLQAHEKT